jgi:mRNA-degrading endonuclease toxin of MazEF toxin-antitoxin module
MMMSDKYIISYMPTEYIIAGIFIPKKGYTQEELATGKREAVAVSEEQLAKLGQNAIFCEMVEDKRLRVMDNIPTALLSGAERVTAITAEKVAVINENAALKARIAELEAAVAEKTGE